MSRDDGRKPDEMRAVNLELDCLRYAEGSCMATAGNTRVLCAASIEKRVPPFLVGSGQGWVTAEYGLLPRSTNTRTPRETERPRSRSQEIRRFLGRSLRAVCDLSAFGEQQVIVDCDVIQADGGTRTLALTGGFCALKQAVERMRERGLIERNPLIEHVAATSVGIVDGDVLLDLAYSEDSRADTDMNLVMTESGRIVEVQATAEHVPFRFDEFSSMYGLAAEAINELIRLQHASFKRTGG
ncbi:ribonuclease PH [candidate division WOR-3 bacterium]|nr:ribonuclease PH [candidate division WOR-3 bacterium]